MLTLSSRRFGLAFLCAAAAFAQDSHLTYLGSWPHQVLVFDSVKEKIVDTIDLKNDVPRSLLLSADKKKLYAATLNDNSIVTIDIATRKVTGSFTLDSGNMKLRLMGMAADPGGRLLYSIGTPITKKIDRFDVEPVKFVVIDLQDQKVSKMVDFPKEEGTNFGYRAGMRVSPDGKLLYLFRESVMVFDTTTFKLVKKVDLAKPPTPGMENLSLNMVEDPNEPSSSLTGVFYASDPYVHQAVFGIARIDLSSLNFDFSPIGPAATQMQALLMTPDRKTGYTVAINGTHGNRRCEFWTFDMKSRKLINKQEFEGRTRFFFGMSSDGTKLFIYGAGYQISVYDAKTLKLRNEIDVPGDITTNMVTYPVPANLSAAAR